MRTAAELAKLNDAIQRRLIRIRRLFISHTNRADEDRPLILANVVIELDNLVLSGLRQFTISTLFRARTSSGHRITHSQTVKSEGEASAYIFSVINLTAYQKQGSPQNVSRRLEPTVRDPKSTEKVLRACAASNTASLQNALALNFRLFGDLGTLRNFYAHRNEDTWRKAKTKALSMGLGAVRHADEVLTSSWNHSPVSIFENWTNEASIFFEELMK